MGAGILECDVTFTKDRQLVCRHSQCDLHTTTNILAMPELAAKCTQPFSPPTRPPASPPRPTAAPATSPWPSSSTLCGKMDASNPKATTVAEYLGGTPSFRTDLYSTCGTLVTHAESIELSHELGAKFTPELKAPSVPMPFQGDYTQETYAQQMIDEYKARRGSRPRKVFAQSFNLNDVLYWIGNEPAFGKQAVYLDDRVDGGRPGYDAAGGRACPSWPAKGVQHRGAADVGAGHAGRRRARSCPRRTPTAAKGAGPRHHHLDPRALGPAARPAAATTTSRSPPPSTTTATCSRCSTCWRKQVKIRGIFSDWPATVTYYANCMGL